MQPAASIAFRSALAWTLWLFALNLVLETVQLPLYAIGRYSEWPALGYAVLHRTLGNATAASGAYLIAALVTVEPDWTMDRPLAGVAVVLVAGEAFTLLLPVLALAILRYRYRQVESQVPSSVRY